MRYHVDPDSPVPLYHQIAESIRSAIRDGRLRAGDALTPLRQAAEQWGVNLHTVRHAYTSLAREGLVDSRSGTRGTLVMPRARAGAPPFARAEVTLAGFLNGFLAEARSRHGLNARDAAAALARHVGRERPEVFVVECSRWQAEGHAREIADRYDIVAIPWTLDQGEPPAGNVVATYFHYNDIRKQWPRRLAAVRFLSIHPDPALVTQLQASGSIVVCETDASTAEAVAADLTALVAPEAVHIRTSVVADPNDGVPRSNRSAPRFFSPRCWARLTDASRAHRRVQEIRYVIDRVDLAAVASREGWTASARTSSSGEAA